MVSNTNGNEKFAEANVRKWQRIAETTSMPAALSAMGEYETIMSNTEQRLASGADPRHEAVEAARMLRAASDQMRRTAERVAVGAYEVYRLPGEALADALGVSRATFLKIRREHEGDLF